MKRILLYMHSQNVAERTILAQTQGHAGKILKKKRKKKDPEFWLHFKIQQIQGSSIVASHQYPTRSLVIK